MFYIDRRKLIFSSQFGKINIFFKISLAIKRKCDIIYLIIFQDGIYVCVKLMNNKRGAL